MQARVSFIAGIALVTFTLGAGPAHAQKYDNAPVDVLKKVTSVAQQWANGTLSNYHAPKVTYSGKPITLRTSLHTPAVAYTSKVWKMQFDILEKMSNGKIKPEYSWGGTVHNVSKGFEAVRDGLTDATPCWSFYKATSFPMMQSLFLPGISPNAAVHALLAEKLYNKYFRQEYERQGVYLGRIRATTVYLLFTKTPISTLDQLKGLKVRSGGGIHAAVWRALGASPISMSSHDMYSAFQRGVVDAVSLSDSAAEVFKIDELSKARTYANLSRVVLEMCLSKQWVDALPADLRAVLEVWGRAASQADTQLAFMLHGAEARVKFHKMGMKFVDLSDAQEDLWQKKASVVIDNFIKTNEAKGLPARALVNDMRKIAAQYKDKTPNEIFMEVLEHPVTGIIPPKS